MTAATDTKSDPFALRPGMEFHVGDRVCGTTPGNMHPYYWLGEKKHLAPFSQMVSVWIDDYLSFGVTEAHTEWTTPEPVHSEHAAFRYRITWRPDAPLKIEAWALTWVLWPEMKATPDDICAEDTVRAARRLLGIEPVAFTDEVPIVVSLLTAVRIADELSGDSSVWVTS